MSGGDKLALIVIVTAGVALGVASTRNRNNNGLTYNYLRQQASGIAYMQQQAPGLAYTAPAGYSTQQAAGLL